MAEFMFSPEGRNALRRAILEDAQWDTYRKQHGLSSASLTTDDLERACYAFGLDPSQFGRRKRSYEREVPRMTIEAKAETFTETMDGDDMTQDAKTVALEAKLKAMRELLGNDGIDETRVIELIRQYAARPATVQIDLRRATCIEPLGERLMHKSVPMLLSAINADVPVMLVGPAGSGKTSAAAQCAEILKLPFYFTGALDSPYKLTGFIDAQGRTVETAFRKAFIDGGVFLYDEIDASAPGAVLPFNAALANGRCDFPDGIFERHPDFRPIASANTFGRGADRQYVGRLQQDAAVLDRFAVIDWSYDESLEAAMLGLSAEDVKTPRAPISVTSKAEAEKLTKQWLERVQSVRKRVFDQKVRHVVSPRASVLGARLLLSGWEWNDVESACIFKGLDADTVEKIK